MITYEEAISLLKNGSDNLYSYQTLEIIKALERAKKVEELLELYRERFSFYNFDEDIDLRKIKQKQKELEELK